jgi:hypothetical protein
MDNKHQLRRLRSEVEHICKEQNIELTTKCKRISCVPYIKELISKIKNIEKIMYIKSSASIQNTLKWQMTKTTNIPCLLNKQLSLKVP